MQVLRCDFFPLVVFMHGLVSWDGRVTVAGKWCDLSERGLGIVGSGCGVCGVGIFIAGGALAVHQRFCSGIWIVRRLGGCF